MTPLRTQISGALFAAFTLSAAYTVLTTVNGSVTDGLTATNPAMWLFYAAGFGMAFAARSPRRAVHRVNAVLLTVLLIVSVFAYPDSFTPDLQTPLGWFENDAYVALLAIALWLTIQHQITLTARAATPERSMMEV